MEMVIKATVINAEDILAVEGEKVIFEWPVHPNLPVGVKDLDGNLLGYLGRNDVTCVPGTTTGQDFYQFVREGWHLDDAVVDSAVYYRTKHRKLVLQVVLTMVEQRTLVS